MEQINKDIIYKILREQDTLDKLYPQDSLVENIDDPLIKQRNLSRELAPKLLGRIMDKLELAKEFIKLIPLYYDQIGNWWIWDSREYCWQLTDETDILNFVRTASDSNVVNSKERVEIINAIKLEARANKPEDLGKHVIQFHKELVNLDTGDRFPASPKYFATNPIPWKIGRTGDTSKFDKLFSQWVRSEDIQCLYEIIAYCILPDYPIERIFTLLGQGANGKSTFIKIVYNFLGIKNICSSDLETMSKSRFETTKLYKKLACIIAETNLSNLDQSEKIKKLTSGKDLVSMEFKNKGLMDFVNYAKIIVATNNLPPTDDKTDGFYRRWRIIEFPNQFEKEVDVLADITKEDYENLAHKCFFVLSDLLKNRCFTGDGSILERRKKYEDKSNPFDKFWEEYIDDNNPNADIPCWEFAKELNDFMNKHHVRNLSDRNIAKIMNEKGINQIRKRINWTDSLEGQTKQIRVWAGIQWKR